MSEDSDVDILFEEIVPLKPGTPAFIRQQLHLLENLQKSHNYIPTDYKAFLDHVKSLKTSYQPAVVLAAWKVLLDKHLSILGLDEGPQKKKNCQIPLLNTSHITKRSNQQIYFNNSNTDSDNVKKSRGKNKADKLECKKSVYDNSIRLKNKNKSDLEISVHKIKAKHKGAKHNKSDRTLNSRNCFKGSKSDLDNSNYLNFSSSVDENNSFSTPKHQKHNDRHIHNRIKDESSFIKKSISCPEDFLRCSEIVNKLSSSNCDGGSLSSKEKHKNSCSKRKKFPVEFQDNNCSDNKKKKSKRKSLEDLCSSFLDDSSKNIKSKSNIKNIEKSELDLCGISKSELIKFYKKQNQKKVVENKTLETKMLEQYHDRLVDVIIPKCFSS